MDKTTFNLIRNGEVVGQVFNYHSSGLKMVVLCNGTEFGPFATFAQVHQVLEANVKMVLVK